VKDATNPDIAPRIVEEEPMCSGEECPRCYNACGSGNGFWCGEPFRLKSTRIITDRNYVPFMLCIPGLRRQRDALQAVAGKVLEILRANQILLGVIPGASLEMEHMPEAVEVLVRSVVQVGQMADANAKAFNAAMRERDALQAERDEATARLREAEEENEQARAAQVVIGQIFTFLYQPGWKELIEAVREAHDALNTTRKAGR
jgi:hypothetical protein